MRPLLRRSEDPPADEVVVVRAGVLNRDDAKRAAHRAHGETGILALSVFAALDKGVDELCHDDPDLARYRQLRTTTFGRLRRAGFAVLPTFARPHYDLPELSRRHAGSARPVFRSTVPESRRGLGTIIVMEARFDLWVDYHRRDADGLTHAHADDVESGRIL